MSDKDKIHGDLAQQAILPGNHFVDMGYMSSNVLSEGNHRGINLVEPVRADTSWQVRAAHYRG